MEWRDRTLESDDEKLSSLIAKGKSKAQEIVVEGAQSLGKFFTAETARLLVTQGNAEQFISSVRKSISVIATDRLTAADEDMADAQEILGEAASARERILEKLDHVRDVEWPTLFEDRLRARLLDRLQTTLDVIGFFDPTPLSDGANALIALMRGNTRDFWISAAGALLPYIGDAAKSLKVGKYADDALEGVRRVADDFVSLAGKSVRFFDNACEYATSLGKLGQKIGELLPIGCFVTHTMAGGEPMDNEPRILVQTESPPGFDRAWLGNQLWTCLFVTVAFGGWSAANYRLRRKDEHDERRAAVATLFDSDRDEDFAPEKSDEAELLADCLADCAQRQTPHTPRDAALAELALADSPKVAGILRMPSPSAKRFSNPQRRKQPTRTSTLPRRSGPAPLRRRQSRFGLAWAAVFFCLAAFWAFRAPSRPERQSAPSIASTLPSNETSAPRAAARMKYIEDYRLGERIIVTNPLGGEPDAEPDPATWRTVALRMRKPSGKWMKIKLIQPPEWLAEVQPRTGLTIDLYLPEMGIADSAEVLGVGPCPEIEPGEGSVVTGLFEHESDGNLVNLWLEGCREPIGVTNNHPFFSQARFEFIAAGELRCGELLLTLSKASTVRVVEVTPRPRDEMVYNLRVNGQHVYHVGSLGVLVHNECPWARLKKWAQAEGGYLDPYTNNWIPYNGKLVPDHILPKKDIIDMGIGDLTAAQRSFLLNYPGNIQPLPPRLNSSKGARNALEWARTPLGQGMDPAYQRWLDDTQNGMRAYFEELIELFRRQNARH